MEDRQTLFEEDLWSGKWGRPWLRGNATDEIETSAQIDHYLDLMARLVDAIAVVDDILDARTTALDSSGDPRTSKNESDLVSALERVRDLGPMERLGDRERIRGATGRSRR